MKRAQLLRGLAFGSVIAVLAACSTTRKSERPAELVEFQSTAKIDRVWSANVGSGAPKLRLGLSLAATGGTLFAASHSGVVVAFNQADGKRLWQTATRLPLTAGPGAGQGLVVLGASHGDIVALDAATGKIKWKAYVNSELLSAPVIDHDVVVMRAVDGRVLALRASDGMQLWSAEQQVPRLSLRGTARPSIVGDVIVSGFDNGRVQALQLADGSAIWDTNVAPSAGRTELERLNDIDTALAVRDNDVYAVTFQGKAAELDLATGQILWSHDASSYSGLVLDDNGVYISTADGGLMKLNAATGIETWSTKVLNHRRLSPPALLGELIAVSDLQGFVHFFERDTGALAARMHALATRAPATPLVIDNTLFMLDAEGNIVALRATRVAAGTGTNTKAGKPRAEKPADKATDKATDKPTDSTPSAPVEQTPREIVPHQLPR